MNTNQLPEGMPIEDLIAVYVDSARNTTARIAQCLDALLPEEVLLQLPAVHRLSHNLKGSSFQFGFLEIARLAQAMERLSSHLETGIRAIEEEDHDLLLEAVERLREQVESVASGGKAMDCVGLCRRLEERAE